MPELPELEELVVVEQDLVKAFEPPDHVTMKFCKKGNSEFLQISWQIGEDLDGAINDFVGEGQLGFSSASRL